MSKPNIFERMTTLSKVLLLVVIIGLIGGGLWFAKDLPVFKNVFKGKIASSNIANEKIDTSENGDSKTIKISIDEWIGWSPILISNGGLTTKDGSIYDQLGLNVEISIINDATQSSNALIANKLDGAGYTINRYAFLYPKFQKANVPVVMPFINNYSNGGDGIIAKADIKSVEDLVGKKIAVPRFSEAQTLIEWLLSNSSLSDKEVSSIRKNMIMFETPDDAAKAFFAGQVDAAATWQPYLSQAQETSNARLLFSTKSATNLILDGIVFRKDFAENNKESITLFIKGALMAQDLYGKEFESVRNSMPLFSTESDESIKAMTGDADIADYISNEKLFKGIAQKLFKDMSIIWSTLGETAMPDEYLTAFDFSYAESLKSEFSEKKTEEVKFTDVDRDKAKSEANTDSLLTKRLSVNFETGSATIKQSSNESLSEFSDFAKLLNGVVIQIEGNTDNVGDKQSNKKLSEQRAKAIAKYLQYEGLDITRMVIVGNGDENPVSSNDTSEGKALNRRTDMFFKVVKQ